VFVLLLSVCLSVCHKWEFYKDGYKCRATQTTSYINPWTLSFPHAKDLGNIPVASQEGAK